MPRDSNIMPDFTSHVLDGFNSGVNNVKRSWELTKEELLIGTNVDLNNNGKPSRRTGYVKVITGNFHSIFSTGYICLAIKDDDLVKVNLDLTVTVLRADIGTAVMSYTEVNDIVAYTNGNVIGYVKRDGVAYLFPDPTDEHKLPLPAGQLIEYYNDRIYIAMGNILWWSDNLSHRFGCMDKRKNGRQLASEIVLLKAVKDGLYLSDKNGIYFATGADPFEMGLKGVLPYPAIPGMVCEFDGSLLAEPQQDTVVAIGTKEGVCLCSTSGGQVMNVTIKSYEMLQGNRGAMLFRSGSNMNQIISSVFN